VQDTFDILINSFIKDKIGIADNFLSLPLAIHLKENLNALYANQRLLAAGTGKDRLIDPEKIVRGDKIFWLDRSHNNLHENTFFDLIDEFVLYLNRTCYTGITNYEFHYTLYESGTFYKKHFDQFKNNDGRQYSMIMYLNEDWLAIDGGELSIQNGDKQQIISPNNCKSVFFRSNELEHEVLLTTKARMSITGWFKVN
jgi:SM-20-related protein